VYFAATRDPVLSGERQHSLNDTRRVCLGRELFPCTLQYQHLRTYFQTFDHEEMTMIYQLKVSLRYTSPPIWRRLQLRSDTTLRDLHYILQVAMGWENYHLYQFMSHGAFYVDFDIFRELGLDENMINAAETKLDSLLVVVKDSILYEYDFGDGWLHDIVLEKELETQDGGPFPRCIAGKRAAPPEDVGGPPGYDEFLRIMGDDTHPEHEFMREWLGRDFNPEDFDTAIVNSQLHTSDK
jgi:hypothetical protein